MKTPRLLLPCILLFGAASSLCAAQTYKVKDLGTLSGGDFSVAEAVNATGQVTGASGASNLADIFLYRHGTMTDLGTLGGNTGIGNGINASGQIAGYSTDSAGNYRAFLASGGKLTDIGDLGGGSAVAYAVNDSGQVVGSAVTSEGSNHPFLYSDGKMIDLGTLNSPPGNAFWNSATGINNSGVVTGMSWDAQGNLDAFIWRKGKMKKLGNLGRPWTEGRAINNKGQVTGIGTTKSDDAHLFISTPSGKLKDLGTIGGLGSAPWGFGINDAGVIVGRFTYQGSYHALRYSAGKIEDLNNLIPANSGWALEQATGINNAGQITGTGMHNGLEHAFLLTPAQ